MLRIPVDLVSSLENDDIMWPALKLNSVTFTNVLDFTI